MQIRHPSGNRSGRRFSPYDILFALCFLLILAFCIWKLPYGFGRDDEALYASLPLHFAQGARLITEEWNLTQFFFLLMTPVISLFHAVTGSFDGVMMFLRMLYLAIHALTVMAVYARLRRINSWGALLAGCLLFLFTPYDIMSCSYNTIGLDCMMLAAAMMATGSRNSRVLPAICGVLFSVAVLATPFLALLFVLYFLYAFISRGKDIAVWYRFVWFTAGVAAAALPYLLLVLSQNSLQEILSGLPLLLDDPSHGKGTGILESAAQLLRNAPSGTALLFALYIIHLLVMLMDKKRGSHCIAHLICAVLISLAALLQAMRSLPNECYHAMFPPLAMLGLTAYVLTKNKCKPVFAFMFVPGVVYGLTMHFSSNNGYYAFSLAMFVAAAAGILMMADFVRELLAADNISKQLSRLAACAMLLVYLAAAGEACYVKLRHTFWDTDPRASDMTISSGPAKGMKTHTDTDNAAVYDAVIRDLADVNALPAGKLFVVDHRSWCYLAADRHQISAYSPWLTDLDTLSRVSRYYQLHPNQMPDYVYILHDSGVSPDTVKQALGGTWARQDREISTLLVRE
ncbi:MAG: hypothetical protein Q4C54_07740 [Clostridia bacterium]|nr:hypothetical protein [Clostridia bacterium]